MIESNPEMKFIADFHIHSHYSRATSKTLIPEYLDYWARIKGITVVGTGDFTHPGWLKELKAKLEPAEPGLLKLKDELKLEPPFPGHPLRRNPVRFCLTAEISTIYKKEDRVRKIHHLLFAPDFKTVEKIQKELIKREVNITSDGRPIIGMDSRNLLEIVLMASERTFFVPAHIWTPWFSVLGAKSGFDSIEQCYRDLARHIYAVETGLSSDPPMNWTCGFLDPYNLLSNSDAHSPEKLGREANLFETALHYDRILQAIKSKAPRHFLGTIEFFPQEGKYHFDGHRKCGICLNPGETEKSKGLCPICGKPVTVGVMNRVKQLSDRVHHPKAEQAPLFHSLIPLKEILAEIAGVGPQSKQVSHAYLSLISKLGTEFDILINIPVESISKQTNGLIAEAIRRMRQGEVFVKEGYDGEFGTITVFKPDELSNSVNQKILFTEATRPPSIPPDTIPDPQKRVVASPQEKSNHFTGRPDLSVLPDEIAISISRHQTETANPYQKEAVEHFQGPALVIAGPGTGKTRVLALRIAFLIKEKQVRPEQILAVTFTNKSAQEMGNRTAQLLGTKNLPGEPWISTFHGLGYGLLKKHHASFQRDVDFSIIDEEEKIEILIRKIHCPSRLAKRVSDAISQIKQKLIPEPDITDPVTPELFDEYETTLKDLNIFDLDDLISKVVALFKAFPEVARHYHATLQWCLVDEYQDINLAQYRLLQNLFPGPEPNLMVIGDPNQAIYGFRGSDVRHLIRFRKDYPGAREYLLKQSYRCSEHILQASDNIIHTLSEKKSTLRGCHKGIKINIVENSTARSEAEYVARTIEQMIGGVGFFSLDSKVTAGNRVEGIQSLSDFAVLCRVNHQTEYLKSALQQHRIPFQTIGESPLVKAEPSKSIIQFIKGIKNPRYTIYEINPFFCDSQSIIRSGKIKIMMDQGAPVTQIIQEIHNHCISAKQKNEQVLEYLLEIASGYENRMEDFLKYINLGSAMDFYRDDIEQVSVMTLHAAKGLEFNCVFITGCENGLIPYSLFLKDKPDIDEERRLFYVGMTRARNFLILTHARKRMLHGKKLHLPRSPFLDDIEKELVEASRIEIKRKKKENGIQLKLFDI